MIHKGKLKRVSVCRLKSTETEHNSIRTCLQNIFDKLFGDSFQQSSLGGMHMWTDKKKKKTQKNNQTDKRTYS